MPQAGDATFGLRSTSGPPLARGFVLLGTEPDLAGTDILGATIHVALGPSLCVALPVAANRFGYATPTIPIPPGTAGARFYAQFLWLNTPECGGSQATPAHGALGLGPAMLSASDALALAVQP